MTTRDLNELRWRCGWTHQQTLGNCIQELVADTFVSTLRPQAALRVAELSAAMTGLVVAE